MSLPKVQILILNWNGHQDTVRCLASVFALDYPDFGVVVCDNGSTDGSLGRIREWAELGPTVTTDGDGYSLPRIAATRASIRCVQYDRASAERGGTPDADAELVLIETGGNVGFAAGNNVGFRYIIQRGDADYVWLLNNDTIVAPSALRELVQRAEADPRCAAVGATLFELHDPECVQEMGGGGASTWHGMVNVIGRGRPASAPRSPDIALDYVSGGCALIRQEVLSTVGLLDERFFLYAEDVDWGIRMREAGYTLCYAPAAHVWHKGSGALKRGSPGNDYHNVRGSLLLVQKHWPARLLPAFGYSVFRCLAPKVLRSEWARFAAVLRAYREVARYLLAARSRTAAPSAVSPRSLERQETVSTGAAG